MKLGKFVEISVGVPDLAKSLPFYERLGFERVDLQWEPWPWSVLTDGLITVSLSQSTPGGPILNYFSGDMRERVGQLEARGVRLTRIEERQTPDVVAALTAPEGIGVSLVEYSARRIPKPRGYSVSKCGVFGELAFAVADLSAVLPFWNSVGFERKRGSNLPYPWAVIGDDLITLGFYQTTDFNRAALVYYSDNTPERIEQLTYDGFEPSGEIPSPDYGTGRTVLEPPDGQVLFFLEYRDRSPDAEGRSVRGPATRSVP
jgi:catechol 2,3-dioxygenase-like lactoylglutathione lyase family enzyme